ncbi:MAG: sigma 54-interacting transcriptional regulator [Myxococcaceae bacterium]|nr:sigma 54-interacting transcriptional regulator [Myxococcaceae bacterium]
MSLDATVTVMRRSLGSGEVVDVPALTVHVRSKAGAVTTCALRLSPVVVGTADECHLVVEDAAVSRRHVEVHPHPGGVRLQDLGSKNGTWVAGVRVNDAIVPLNALATVGDSTLWVTLEGKAVTVPLSATPFFGDAFGASLAMRALFAGLERAAASDASVLLLGESGTGKELLAKGVHTHSARKAKPFVVLDCGSVPPNLIESVLFGHTKGAFTGADRERPGIFEEADGGTLFIDEVGELPLDMQPRLLRVLETGTVRTVGGEGTRKVDVRVVAATHRDLKERIKSGEFREDLYYRLAVIEFEVPPLRQRKEDLPDLISRLLGQLEPPRSISELPRDAMEMLTRYDWPGNVRELRNAVTRLALLGNLSLDGGSTPTVAHDQPVVPLAVARDQAVAEFESRYLREVLKGTQGNVTAAAAALGISRQQLHRLMVRHDIKSREL